MLRLSTTLGAVVLGAITTAACGEGPTFFPTSEVAGWETSMASRELAVGANPIGFHVGADAAYISDFWFRYQNRIPDVANFQGTAKLEYGLGELGEVYGSTFLNVSAGGRRKYKISEPTTLPPGQFVAPGAAVSDGPAIPAGAITQVDFTVGYEKWFANLVGVGAGWTGFYAPSHRTLQTREAAGFFQTDTGASVDSFRQEVFTRFDFNDSKYLGYFALHPYAFIGFDTDGDYSQGAGQYFEFGVSHEYDIPYLTGLSLTPHVALSAMHDEKLLDRDGGRRDGYLGTTVGLSVDYDLNHLLGIGQNYGTYTVSGFVDGVFAGDRYAQPTGSNSDDVVSGVRVGVRF